MTSEPGPIPDWDPSGLLPPFLDSPALGGSRSPYHAGLTDMVLRFGDTGDRRKLLRGLLDYRAALHAADLRVGFQWVNGSFVEDTAQHAQREPNDIDLVTFLQLPDERTQAQWFQDNPSLFDPRLAKAVMGQTRILLSWIEVSLPELGEGECVLEQPLVP